MNEFVSLTEEEQHAQDKATFIGLVWQAKTASIAELLTGLEVKPGSRYLSQAWIVVAGLNNLLAVHPTLFDIVQRRIINGERPQQIAYDLQQLKMVDSMGAAIVCDAGMLLIYLSAGKRQ